MTRIAPRLDLRGRTLVHALSHWAQHRPDDTAFRYLQDGESSAVEITFAALEREAVEIAASLHECTAPGDRALLIYPQGLDFISAFLGCLYAGVIAVPAYPPHRGRLERTLPRLRAIAADCGARAVLTTSAGEGALAAALDGCPELGRARWIATDSLLLADSLMPLGRDDFAGPCLSGSRDVAFLQYTSGSTGTPKGVMITHANLTHNSECIRTAFQHDDGLIGVGWLPLYHDMGLIGKVLQPLYLGRPCTLMAPLDFLKRPVRWLQAISRYRATTSGGPNFAYDLCARKISEQDKARLDLSSWKVAFVGAEPVRKATLDRFYEAFASAGFRREAFQPAYGLAENTLMVASAAPGRAATALRVDATALSEGRAEPAREAALGLSAAQTGAARAPARSGERPVDLVSSGEPGAELEVLVVDPDRHVRRDDARVGEIWVRGQSVAAGYWNRPDESAAVFGARLAGGGEPYLRTGDLGFMQAGQLYVTGRIKDLIIVAGRNHYPQDIEQSVERASERVRPGGVAAFAVEVDDRERLVVAAEVEARRLTAENAGWLDELVQLIRHTVTVGHDVQPFAVWLLPPGALPKTSSGKLQRRACRRGFEADTLQALVRWESREALEEPPRLAEHELIYVDLDARRRKIDRRHTRYQFDLERDIPWDRVGEAGQFFGSAYLEMIGVNEAALREHPPAYDACQWALALATCCCFITVEEYLIHFTQREQVRLGKCRSLELFREEEHKHVELFSRHASALRRERPDLAERIQPYLDRCNTAHEVATANASGMDERLFHYQFWLYALVLEEGSIHICDKIAPEASLLRPAWLATHILHRREELQHVATDSVHVKALALSPSEREQLSQMWFRHLANNWGYMHGVQAAHALLEELYPEVAAAAFPSPMTMPPKFLDELLTHRAFSATRSAAPFLRELGGRGLASAREELARSCHDRSRPMLPPRSAALVELPTGSRLADVAAEAKRDTVKSYLLDRISEAARVERSAIIPSQHLLDVGIDSVAGAELVGQIERDLGVSVPFSTVFDSTIDGLIEHIAIGSESPLAA